LRIFIWMGIYTITCQFFLGFRPDLSVQLTQPLFVIEIVLLALLLLSSVISSVLIMYPDVYQKSHLLHLPYGVCVLLVGVLVLQLLTSQGEYILATVAGTHGMQCTLCIAAAAIIPSAVLFMVLRKGASVRQFQAGSLAVLASSAIGCLTLRLAEENDSIMHLIQWHYIPTCAFAVVGALAGKWLLRW
jgi:hypothetical protein